MTTPPVPPPPGTGPAPGAIPDLSEPRRTSPLAVLLVSVRTDALRQGLPALVVAVSSGRFLLVGGLLLVALLAGNALAWWRRTWSFDGAVLHLDEGVLTRAERRIPVERIQHVELERSLRHQLFGLAGVRVETAGGGDAELRLDAIPRPEAEGLRAAVARVRPGVAAEDAAAAHTQGASPVASPPVAVDDAGRPLPPPPGAGDVRDGDEVLVRLTPGRLLLAGVTGPEVASVLAAVAVGLSTLDEIGLDPERLDGVDLGRVALALLLVVAVPAWFLAAGLVSVVTRWDLTARLRDDELHVTYGLLTRRELVMRIERVQEARIVQRPLLRPFGRADLRLRSAGSGTADRSKVAVPVLSSDEIDRILARVLPGAVPAPPLLPAPPAARARSLVRGAGVGAVVGGLAAVLVGRPLGIAAGAALGLVVLSLGVALGESRHRNLGWAEAGGVHRSRTGVLGRHTHVVPAARVQSARTVSTWFQRRRGLARVAVDLAGSSGVVVDRDEREARAIASALVRRP